MQTDPILALPYDVFYSLLTTGDMGMLIVLKDLYGGERKDAFRDATYFFQQKHHLPGLSDEEILAIISEKTDDEKALFSFDYGDFPEFVASLKLEAVN